MALMAYSALDRLRYCCGEQQPWIVMPTHVLDSLHEAQPFQMLLLDVIIPDGGDATPELAAVLAQLSDNAGQLVLGLAASGDTVATASSRYAEDDATARDEFAGAKAG